MKIIGRREPLERRAWADGDPLNVGEHPVEQDNVVVAIEGRSQSGASVVAYIHGHALEEKLDFDDASEGTLVFFNKEYPHRFHPRAAKSVFAMPAQASIAV